MGKPILHAIKIEHVTDPDPDLSGLGEYSDTPGPDDRTIDRPKHDGFYYRNQRRYFIAAMSGDETGNPESVEQDYQRAEAYNRQEWYMLGIRAIAEVHLPTEQGGYSSVHYLKSPGLWGVESDSDKDYLTKVAKEELEHLREILAAFNVDTSNFDELAEKALAAPVSR